MTTKKTLLLILVPLLVTFACQRFYLHLVPIRHFCIAGHLVHHLFFGILIEVPAAFVLAFGVRRSPAAILAPIALGIGSAMILDEVFYLTATDATTQDYRSPVSLWGAVILITMATGLLLGLYRLAGRKPEDSSS